MTLYIHSKNNGTFGIFLTMSNAGFISSTVSYSTFLEYGRKGFFGWSIYAPGIVETLGRIWWNDGGQTGGSSSIGWDFNFCWKLPCYSSQYS